MFVGEFATNITMLIFFEISTFIQYASQFILAFSLIRVGNFIKINRTNKLKIIGLFIFSSVIINLILSIIYNIIVGLELIGTIIFTKFILSSTYIRGFLYILIPIIGITLVGNMFSKLKEINGYYSSLLIIPILSFVIIFIWIILVILPYMLQIAFTGMALLITLIIIECVTITLSIGSFTEFLVKSYNLKPENIIDYRMKLG